jgi:very-short-patch-repair endonuclease
MERPRIRARRLRGEQTSAEARLWRALRGRRLERGKFRRQHPIDRYIVDFVCLDAKLIVEVDGATHGEEADLRRDAERTRVLETLGFHVIRVGNRDVYDNLDSVLELIFAELHPN